MRESKQVLLEELEAIKNKSDISKKKFEDSLMASKKKLEQELDVIEQKRKAQEEVRWSRPMDGYSSTLSPSKMDGFSISPANSPSPQRRSEMFTGSKLDSTFSSIDFSPGPSRERDSFRSNSPSLSSDRKQDSSGLSFASEDRSSGLGGTPKLDRLLSPYSSPKPDRLSKDLSPAGGSGSGDRFSGTNRSLDFSSPSSSRYSERSKVDFKL